MLIFPAIDIYEGKAVRLYKGDYAKMTVYSESPVSVSEDFKNKGAGHIHIVDLEGARYGTTPNFELVCKIKQSTGLFCEIGGGVRSMDTVEKYVSAGIDRVILGTAAVKDERFLSEAAEKYGEKIAVGADIKDGFVAIRGWTENSEYTVYGFFDKMQKLGIKTVICTDVSKDGAMQGSNNALYRELNEKYNLNIVASGGVSSIEDVKLLSDAGLYAAIIGKAYYTGDIKLEEAVKIAE